VVEPTLSVVFDDMTWPPETSVLAGPPSTDAQGQSGKACRAFDMGDTRYLTSGAERDILNSQWIVQSMCWGAPAARRRVDQVM